MYVLNCIPIARSARKDTLSYLSKKKIQPGSLVEVPLRKQTVPALVLSCDSARDIKSTIRTSDFQFRKIKSTPAKKALTKAFISAAHKTSEHFASHIGQVFFALTPKNILSEEFEKVTWSKDIRKTKRDWFVLQEKDADRFSQYKKLIRENFGKKQSVFLCISSMQDGEQLQESIQKGIEEYVFFLHSRLSKKKLRETWQAILSTKHPVVIIGTPMFLSIPRTDITKIILERESSSAYQSVSTPRIDNRVFVEYIAQELQAELIFADTLLRLTTLYRQQQKELKALTPLSFRSLTQANVLLFDMTEEHTPLVFHEHPDKLIRLTKENNEHTFVFAARKGLAPLTTCQDCGHIVTASDGSAPMVLYEHPEGNYFYSPHTKEKRPADTVCSYCGGWRLKPLGLGIDTIEKEVRKIAPDTKIFRLDKGSVSSHKKAKELILEFYDTPGAILIGTEFATNYLKEVDHCIITTIDSTLSLPDFQIQEKVLRILLAFRGKATKNFVIQTRNPDQPIFNYAQSGDIETMLKTEIESREKFSFPPFCTLIKITLQGQEEIIKEHAQEIVHYLDETEADIYPAHVSKIRGSHILNILLRVDSTTWPNHILADKLRAMPPHYQVRVHPENIL